MKKTKNNYTCEKNSTSQETNFKRNVLFPEFLECSKYTFDPFWKEIFVDCACGIFPKGISKYEYLSNDQISLKRKKIEEDNTKCGYFFLDTGEKKLVFKDTIENNEDEFLKSDMFNTCLSFFKQDLEICSTRELDLKKLKRKPFSQDSSPSQNETCEKDEEPDNDKTYLNNWKKIKPKTAKNQLIVNYLCTLKNKYNLSKKEVLRLRAQIYLNLQYHNISAEEIDYRDGVIQNITCLSFNEEKREFFIEDKKTYAFKTEKQSQTTNKYLSSIDRHFRINKKK